MLQSLLRGFDGEGGAVLALTDEAALLDTGARLDPLVGRVEGALEVLVGHDPAPEGPTDADDLAAGAAVHRESPVADAACAAERASSSASGRPAPAREMPSKAFSTPLASELPCPITTEPETPSRKEPP